MSGADAPADAGAFLAWWFAPWRQAGAVSAAAMTAAPVDTLADTLADRDRYRQWCAEAGVPAQVPVGAEPAWRDVVVADGAALCAAARLFGGLLAARGHEAALLRALEPRQRQWCASVAAAQPLAVCARRIPAAPDGAELPEEYGLAQLACHLEHGHPGLWPRLRRCLTPALAARADALAATLAPLPLSAPARARLLRCWRLCRVAGAA